MREGCVKKKVLVGKLLIWDVLYVSALARTKSLCYNTARWSSKIPIILLGIGATAARHALDVKIEVRILDPQQRRLLFRSLLLCIFEAYKVHFI